MPTFNFDDEPSNIIDNAADALISFADDGVTFTLSSAARNPGNEALVYSADSDIFSISESSNPGGVTLTFSDGAGNTQFAGAMTINVTTAFTGGSVVFLATNPADNVIVPLSVGLLSTGPTTGNFMGIQFSTAGFGLVGVSSLTTAAPALTCFLTGTQIATPDGTKNVEAIKAGDIITTVDGQAEVQWLGVQHVDAATTIPAKVNPICFSAGSIADGVPVRDLFLSPNHAVEIGGRLYDAHTLVNGRSIYQVAQPGSTFTYYHIETKVHELLLAENTPAETFVDFADRVNFTNGAERGDAPMVARRPCLVNRVVSRDVGCFHIKAKIIGPLCKVGGDCRGDHAFGRHPW